MWWPATLAGCHGYCWQINMFLQVNLFGKWISNLRADRGLKLFCSSSLKQILTSVSPSLSLSLTHTHTHTRPCTHTRRWATITLSKQCGSLIAVSPSMPGNTPRWGRAKEGERESVLSYPVALLVEVLGRNPCQCWDATVGLASFPGPVVVGGRGTRLIVDWFDVAVFVQWRGYHHVLLCTVIQVNKNVFPSIHINSTHTPH